MEDLYWLSSDLNHRYWDPPLSKFRVSFSQFLQFSGYYSCLLCCPDDYRLHFHIISNYCPYFLFVIAPSTYFLFPKPCCLWYLQVILRLWWWIWWVRARVSMAVEHDHVFATKKQDGKLVTSFPRLTSLNYLLKTVPPYNNGYRTIPYRRPWPSP